MESDLEAVERMAKELKGSPNSLELQRSLLSLLRLSKMRRSDLVHQYGTEALHRPSKLGDEGKARPPVWE